MLATIMSIVRLHSIYVYTLAEDPFRDGILVSIPPQHPRISYGPLTMVRAGQSLVHHRSQHRYPLRQRPLSEAPVHTCQAARGEGEQADGLQVPQLREIGYPESSQIGRGALHHL